MSSSAAAIPGQNDLVKTTIWQNRKAIFICSIISCASFQYGLDFSLIGGFQAMRGFLEIFGYADPMFPGGYNIDSTVQQLIGSLMTLGAFLGSLAAGPMAKFLNRRQSIGVGIVLCCISLAIMLATTSVKALYVARLILGLANGIWMTFVQLYLQECAPPHLRGTMFTFFQWWVSFGSLIGTIIDNYTAPIKGRPAYQIPLAILFFVPTALTIILPFIPDSPRWLIQQGRDEDALNHLTRLRGSAYPATAIAEEFQEIKESYRIEQELAKGVSFLDMFRGNDLRRTIVSVAAVSLQAASGAMFLLIYGVYFFEVAGSDAPFVDGIIIAVIGLVSVMMMSYIVRLMPRRTILMSSIAVQALTMLVMAIIYTVAPNNKAALKGLIAMLCIYIFWYGGWLGPIAWVVGGEVPSQRLRSATLGLAAAVGFFGGWVAAFTAPYFINTNDLAWGPKYGYIWFGSNAIALVWVFFFLPECKDRTLEEIDEMFHNHVPARKFSSYQCVGAQQFREHGIEKLEKSGGDLAHIEHVGSAGPGSPALSTSDISDKI